jgi:hypothetical protein
MASLNKKQAEISAGTVLFGVLVLLFAVTAIQDHLRRA